MLAGHISQPTYSLTSRLLFRVLPLAVLCFCISFFSASAEVVRVEAAFTAQGMTVLLNGQCYVVSPMHALEDGPTSDISVTDETGAQTTATFERNLGHDLALLRIDGNSVGFCRQGWPLRQDSAEDTPTESLVIRGIKPNGVLTSMPATLQSSAAPFLTLRPTYSSDVIGKEMSGSAVLGNRRIIAMLMSVQNGVGKALRISRINSILRDFPTPGHRPPGNLSGTWSLVPEVGGPLRGGRQTLVEIVHSDGFLKVLLKQPGPDLSVEDGWREGVKLWEGEVQGREGIVDGYGRVRRTRNFDDGSIGSPVRRSVDFRVSSDQNMIETELVIVETGDFSTNYRQSVTTRPVTLHRVRDGARYRPLPTSSLFLVPVLYSPEPDRPGRRPEEERSGAPASGQEALRELRRIFDRIGYQDYSGKQREPIRFQTSVKSFRDCELVMQERRHINPDSRYTEVTLETTYLQMGDLDADEIRSTGQQMGDFPDGSWFIEVPAGREPIRVEAVRSYGGRESERREGKTEKVFFYLRDKASSIDAARALQVLARACGAK